MMTKDEVLGLFYDCCQSKDTLNITKLYKLYPQYIDLTDEKIQPFLLAISLDATALLNVLIDLYIETKLQGEIDSKEYKVAYHTLQYMLEEALEQTEPSQEIKAIIAQYICDKKDSESDNISTAPEEFTYDNNFGLEEPGDSNTSLRNSDATLDLTIDNLKQWSESYPGQELAGNISCLPEET